ncbi:unnamed protein product, partial [Urochloa humidicola]
SKFVRRRTPASVCMASGAACGSGGDESGEQRQRLASTACGGGRLQAMAMATEQVAEDLVPIPRAPSPPVVLPCAAVSTRMVADRDGSERIVNVPPWFRARSS